MLSLEDWVFNPVLLLDQVLAGHHLGRHCHRLPPSAPPSLQPDAKYQIDRDLLKRKRKEKKRAVICLHRDIFYLDYLVKWSHIIH